ncbi:MAG: hypothetical protein MUF42_07520 [Cytophagaceae bacterium]|jgi:hypothetical protein|nr:hypothetical protein [Cytophagaceae bacterium]
MKYFWALLAIALLATCKTNKRSKGETFPEMVTLRVVVKTTNGTPVGNARINIFENLQDYNAALSDSNQTPGYRSLLSMADGSATLDSVKPNLDQYILVSFLDSLNNQYLSNQNLSSILTKIPESTVIDLEIQIEPLSSNIAFFTLSPNVLAAPIIIRLNSMKDTLDINAANAASVSPTSTDALIKSVAPGFYTYQAFTSAGCTWTGSFTVVAGEFKKIQFDACNLAKVTFYFFDTAPTSSVNFGSYDVLVDGVKIGNLTNIHTNNGAPLCGSNDNVFSVTTFVDAGTAHTYQIKNSTSPCTWISTFVAGPASSCNLVGVSKTTINSNICP